MSSTMSHSPTAVSNHHQAQAVVVPVAPPTTSPATVSTPGQTIDLFPDMQLLADAFRLGENARLALTNYDARTLEDFSMMTTHDFESMLVNAARLHHPLCPLQQRKISVLLEWTRQMVEEYKEEKTLKAFGGRPQRTLDRSQKPATISSAQPSEQSFHDEMDTNSNSNSSRSHQNQINTTDDSYVPSFTDRLFNPLGTLEQARTRVEASVANSYVEMGRLVHHHHHAQTQQKQQPALESSAASSSPSSKANTSHDRSPRKGDSSRSSSSVSLFIPPDWEERFHRDLPMLKLRLKQAGEEEKLLWSFWSDSFITLRWVFCGYDK